MLTKLSIALALIIAVTSGALTADREQHGGAAGPYDSQGNYRGPGPDPRNSVPSRYEAPDTAVRRRDPGRERWE
jgi:hypothetical protein